MLNKGTFKRERPIHTIEEVEELLSYADKYGLKIVKIGMGGDYGSLEEATIKQAYKTIRRSLIIQLKLTKLCITTSYFDGKPTTFIFDLNLNLDTHALKGQQAFAQFQRYFKIPKASDYNIPGFNDKWLDAERNIYACSARPILGFNPKYDQKETSDVYEYDLNSAYSAALMDKVIDLSGPAGYKQEVKEGQVGFLLNDELTMIYPGQYADVIFNEIDSPSGLKEYCLKYYKLKQETTGSEKQQAKGMLNFPIGYAQRINPFFRAYVVHKCNETINELIDDNSLCWNTDAIFSTKPKQLNIGNEIGQFKVEHFDTFRMKGNTYQIDDQLPITRGVPKEFFKRFEYLNGRKFNLLTDVITEHKCRYSFNFETLQLEDNYE